MSELANEYMKLPLFQIKAYTQNLRDLAALEIDLAIKLKTYH